MGVSFLSKGNFNNTEKMLDSIIQKQYINVIERNAEEALMILSDATPKRTGKTAASWNYNIEIKNNEIIVNFNNSNVQNGVNIALIIQYGHGTGRGGYVQGRDYLNPVLRPIFDKIANELWKEVTEP